MVLFRYIGAVTAEALIALSDWSFHVASPAPFVVVLVPSFALSQRESPLDTPPGLGGEIVSTVRLSSSTF